MNKLGYSLRVLNTYKQNYKNANIILKKNSKSDKKII